MLVIPGVEEGYVLPIQFEPPEECAKPGHPRKSRIDKARKTKPGHPQIEDDNVGVLAFSWWSGQPILAAFRLAVVSKMGGALESWVIVGILAIIVDNRGYPGYQNGGVLTISKDSIPIRGLDMKNQIDNDEASIPIHEETYKADLELLSKSQAFSSELLRLSLLGLSVFGVLLKYLVFHDHDTKKWFILSIICFGICAGFSLFHRYFSTKGLMYHILNIRKPSKDYANDRNRMQNRSASGLAIASCFMALALLCLCSGFVKAALGK